MEAEPDPDANLKKVGLSFGVANRLKKLMKNRPKLKQRTEAEIEEELLVKAQQDREKRIASF